MRSKCISVGFLVWLLFVSDGITTEKPPPTAFMRSEDQGSQQPAFMRSEDQASQRPAFMRSEDQASQRPAFMKSEDQASQRPAFMRSEDQASQRPAFMRSEDQAFLKGEDQGSQRPAFLKGEDQGSQRPAFLKGEDQGSQQPAFLKGEDQASQRPAFLKEEDQGSQRPAFLKKEDQGSQRPAFLEGEDQGSQRPAFLEGEDQGSQQPAFLKGEDQGSLRPAFLKGEEQGSLRPAFLKGEDQGSQRPAFLKGEDQASQRPAFMRSEDQASQWHAFMRSEDQASQRPAFMRSEDQASQWHAFMRSRDQASQRPAFIRGGNNEDAAFASLKSLRESDLAAIKHLFAPFASGDYFYTAQLNEFLQNEVNMDPTNQQVQCYADIVRVILDLSRGRLYALRVVDAMGRPPSGILLGNFQWWGSYEECKGIVHKQDGNDVIRTDYYLVTLTAMGLLPVNLGVCVPNTCDEESVILVMDSVLGILPSIPIGNNNTLDLLSVSNIKSTQTQAFDAGDIVAIVIFCILGVMVLTGSIYDALLRRNIFPRNNVTVGRSIVQNQSMSNGASVSAVIRITPESNEQTKSDTPANIGGRLLLAFSIITNGQKLLNTDTKAKHLGSLHGIRVISTFWVILGHVYSMVIGKFDNLIPAMMNSISGFSVQAISNAYVAVDTFFFLSGFLVGFLTLKEMHKKRGKINWFMFYFHRFWRLTPVYMLILMFYCTLWRHIPRGPMQNVPREDPDVNACYKYWWTNLLYINNFYPLAIGEYMCMTWTWYLSNDMQFYVISPFVLVLFYKYWKAGLGVALGLILMNLSVTGAVSRVYNLSPLVTYQPEQFDKEQHTYMWPYHRIAPYAVGLILAFYLNRVDCKLTMNKMLVLLGWAVSMLVGMLVVYGLYPYYDPETWTSMFEAKMMDPDVAALYNATYTLAWALALSWVVLACVTGYGGPINVILSWKGFSVLGRLSYTAYLVHVLVIHCYMNSRKTPMNYSDYNQTYFFLGHLVLTYMVAFVVTLTCESPMMALEKILFSSVMKTSKKSEVVNHKNNTKEQITSDKGSPNVDMNEKGLHPKEEEYRSAFPTNNISDTSRSFPKLDSPHHISTHF